jgi:hypothetical protein
LFLVQISLFPNSGYSSLVAQKTWFPLGALYARP